MKRKERKLARLVLGALVAGSGALYMTSAEASGYYNITMDTTINDETHQNDIVKMDANSIALTIASGGKVYGIETGAGQTGNTITVYGTVSPYAQSIVGGATNMKVYIKEGADIMASVRAGTASGTTEVTNNLLEMSGGEIHNDNLIGGAAASGDATVNTVNISGGTGIRRVAGGSSNYGNATNNTVNITGGTISGNATSGNVYGGVSYSTTTKNADKNSVNISGGSVTNNIYGGYAKKGAANENTVTISRGTVNGNIYGGQGGTEASGNTVTISGGTVGDPNGWAEIRGGEATSGAANKNTVTISGGTINNDVWGGSGATADGNTVTISGNTVFLSTKGIHGASAMTGDATNNTVNILTTQPITFAHLYGGLNETGGTTSSGNTLNLAAKDVTVGTLDKFQNMNFYLPSNIANDDTMLTVTGGTLNSKTNLTGVAVGAAVQSGATLVKGDAVNLITNPNGLTTDSTTTMKQITDETVTIQTKPTAKTLTTDQAYELELAKTADETTIVATVKDVKETPGGGGNGSSGGATNDGLKSPVETRAAVTTFVNAGADMLASQGFAQAANAVALDMAESAKTGAGAPNVGGFTPFAAFGGSSMRAESGSHVDTKGFGLNIGFARELPNRQGKLLFGPVVEYGGGSYDSYNNDVHGEGGAHYFGVGLMARQVNHDGFYYEGSVRGGRVTSDYKSFDVRPGNKVEYDSSSNYWAAHLGVGKVFAAGKQGTVDGYLKYFYSHQGGDDTDIKLEGGAGERVSFDAINSNRIRIGARYTHKINEMNSLYGGLAYQYEFGGEARAHYSTSGVAPSPSVKGSSGMLELGWQVKPGGPVTLDLGVTGWAGKQRGGSVQLGATWTF